MFGYRVLVASPDCGKTGRSCRKIREEQKEKLYEAKLNFFANITHELCTPLTLINGVNDYIKTSADRLADGKLEKYARILGENVTSLNELIQEILDLRKIEEAGIQPNTYQTGVCKRFGPEAM